MWIEEFGSVCRKHPDVVAVYESPGSTLALLLRQTLVPLREERGRWLHDTRRVARAVTVALQAAGLADDVIVLQWRPLGLVNRILHRWACRYDGDPARHAQLGDIVRARLGDGRPGEPAEPPAPSREVAEADGLGRPGLTQWYRAMAPCWLGVEPPLRRHLVLATHRWIVERVLGPISRGERPTVEDLGPSGRLEWVLVRIVPSRDLRAWRWWIHLLLEDLQRALAWPPARRTEAWVRWLFLIPYSIPAGGRERALAPGGFAVPSARPDAEVPLARGSRVPGRRA